MCVGLCPIIPYKLLISCSESLTLKVLQFQSETSFEFQVKPLDSNVRCYRMSLWSTY